MALILLLKNSREIENVFTNSTFRMAVQNPEMRPSLSGNAFIKCMQDITFDWLI